MRVGMATVCGCSCIVFCTRTPLFGHTRHTRNAGFGHYICKCVGRNIPDRNCHHSLREMGMVSAYFNLWQRTFVAGMWGK